MRVRQITQSFIASTIFKQADSTGQCYKTPTAYTAPEKRQNIQQLYLTIQELIENIKKYTSVSSDFSIEDLRNSKDLVTKKYRQAIYFGQSKNGQKNGKGIMLYTNNRLYEGQWVNNFKQGKGFQRFPNKSVYQGDFMKGKPEGFGRYEWNNGEVYEGQWIDGLKNGSGIWRGSKGDSYIGEWKDGKADGYGVHTWINGDRYEGQFQNCLKHGEGLQKFANGDSYKGFYQYGKPNGYGQYYWVQGSFFKGLFKNGLRQGKGIWKKGLGNTNKYEGLYKNDKKQGCGVFSWGNGSIYRGQYRNDQRQGYGQMHWADGSYYKGEWIQGFPQGQAIQNITQSENLNKIVINERQNFLSGNQFQEDVYKQPERPYIFQTNKKHFRTRDLTSNKSCKTRSYAVTPHNKPPLNTTQYHPKLNKKYSVGSKIVQHSKDKLSYSALIQDKNMSASFFLNKRSQYKKSPKRVIKTSGGTRNRRMVQQINHFAKTRINLQFW